MSEARRPQGAPDAEYAAQPDGNPSPAGNSDGQSASFSELVSGVVHNVQNIVRSEVQLAKTEIREEAMDAGKAAGMLAAGAVMGFYAVGLLLMTVVWILATQLANWLAALIVTVAVAAIAGVMVMVGKSRMQSVNPKPEQTIDSVKEDVEWVKQHKP